MPSAAYLMLRSARRARLEARTAPMQPQFPRCANSFTSSQTMKKSPAVSDRCGDSVAKAVEPPDALPLVS